MSDWPLHECAGWQDVPHGWTDRTGPDFKSDPASDIHGDAVSHLAARIDLTDAAWVRQVHGGQVLKAYRNGLVGEADALWTDRAGRGVVGRSADCPLVLVAGRKNDGTPAAGFAHASWRSTRRGITGKLVAEMINAGVEPRTMSAVICPSAGPCCYEVGDEVRDAFRRHLGDRHEAAFRLQNGRILLDLWSANRSDLIDGGVPASAVAVASVCTICSPDFPSFRRDGDLAGRFAGIIAPPRRAGVFDR